MGKLPKLLLFLVVMSGCFFGIRGHGHALSGADFRPGRIIDDVVFTNRTSMNSWQIQQFLESKVLGGSCDADGSRPSTRWNATANRYYTHAEWGALNSNPAPFVCLTTYRENSTTKQTNIGNPSASIAGSYSAADIIYLAAQQYNINPQVLLVLLQKEQSLITDDWPWANQYKSATGAYCPDTAGCDATKAGFGTQVYEAARLFRSYMDSPFLYFIGNNNILYNPDRNCGTSTVYIENSATEALYHYTPYQPNAAALNNLYGTGDSCSAYGNRNFWRMFSDWFGSTTAFNGSIRISKGIGLGASVVSLGDTVTASYEVENTASYAVLAGSLGICGRLNGAYYDFGLQNDVTISATSKKTIAFSKYIDSGGTLNLFVCSYNQGAGGWTSGFYPYITDPAVSRNTTSSVADNPLITSGISFSPANPSAGQIVTASVTVRNTSSSPLYIGALVVSGRDPAGNNVDFAEAPNITIAANSTYVYTRSRAFVTPGYHMLTLYNWRGGSWDRGYPRSVTGSIIRQVGVTVLDNPLITSGISLSPSNPSAGQPVTASMAIRNNSATSMTIGSMVIGARDSSGNNLDFDIVNDVTIAAGATYTYSKQRSFPSAGYYTLFIANWNGVWSKAFPKSADNSVVRLITLSVLENPLLVSGITLSANPTAGQPLTASLTLRNTGPSPINIGLIVVAVRNALGTNLDFTPDDNVTVPAGGSYTYSKTQTLPAGAYNIYLANYKNGVWSLAYPKPFDSSVRQKLNLTL